MSQEKADDEELQEILLGDENLPVNVTKNESPTSSNTTKASASDPSSILASSVGSKNVSRKKEKGEIGSSAPSAVDHSTSSASSQNAPTKGDDQNQKTGSDQNKKGHKDDDDDKKKSKLAPTILPSIGVFRRALLSQLVELGRFTIHPSLLQQNISKERLKKALEHGNVTSKEIDDIWPYVAAVDENTNTVEDELTDFTFGDALDNEFLSFPETTFEQRQKLINLILLSERYPFVTKDDVWIALKDEFESREELEESQLFQYIFATEAPALPIEVFKDIVYSLSRYPAVQSFSTRFTRAVGESGRSLYGFYLYMVLLIVILSSVPRLWDVQGYMLRRAIHQAVDDEWDSGCTLGRSDPRGCFFSARKFSTITTLDEAFYFMHHSLIPSLWRGQGPTSTAAEPGVVGNTIQPVGALLLRLVPDIGHPNSSSPVLCAQNNVSDFYKDYHLARWFGCGDQWRVVLPFNLTQAEAVQKATQIPFQVDNQAAYLLVAQFGVYQPSTGLYAYTWMQVGAGSGGGSARSNLETVPIILNAHQYLLGILIVTTLVLFFKIFVALFYRYYSPAYGFWSWDLAVEITSYVFFVLSYEKFRTLPELRDAWWDVTIVPGGFDHMADQYDTAKVILAFWCLWIIGSITKYFSYIERVQIANLVVARAFSEIVGMCLVFWLWFMNFWFISMVLFGLTVEEFSSPVQAARGLWLYWSGESNYELLVQNYPIQGAIFFYVYQIFVAFFALNLLVAVLTTPMEEIREEGDLHRQLYAKIEQAMRNSYKSTWMDHFRWSLRKNVTIPLVTFLYDALPSPAGKLYWIQLNLGFRAIYKAEADYKGDEMTDEQCATIANRKFSAIRNLSKLLLHQTRDDEGFLVQQVSNKACSRIPWNSRLRRQCVEEKIFQHPVEFAQVELMIVNESRFKIVRDARLVKALVEYDRFLTELKRIDDMHEELKYRFQRYEKLLSKISKMKKHHHRHGQPTSGGDSSATTTTNDAAGESGDGKSQESIGAKTKAPFTLSTVSAMVLLKAAIVAPVASAKTVVAHSEAALEKTVSLCNTATGKLAEVIEDGVVKSAMKANKAVSQAMPKMLEFVEKYLQDKRNFHLTEFTMRKTVTFRSFLLYALLIFGVYLWLYMPVLSGDHPTGRFVGTLESAFRKYPKRQSCGVDPQNCAEDANTFAEAFDDINELEDWYSWMSGVYLQQLTLRKKLNWQSPDSIYSDPRVHVMWPIYIRQLRAPSSTCNFGIFDASQPFLVQPAFEQRYQQLKDNLKCFSLQNEQFETPFSSEMVSFPTTASSSAPPYPYSWNCIENQPLTLLGIFANYPCEGYTAVISNLSHLQSVLNSGWIDNATRLVAVTTHFNATLPSGEVIFTQYNMYTEFCDGAACAYNHVRSYAAPTSAEADIKLRVTLSVIFLCCLDLLPYFYRYTRFAKAKAKMKLQNKLVEMRKKREDGTDQSAAFISPGNDEDEDLSSQFNRTMRMREQNSSVFLPEDEKKERNSKEDIVPVFRPDFPVPFGILAGFLIASAILQFKFKDQYPSAIINLVLISVIFTYQVMMKVLLPFASLLSKTASTLFDTFLISASSAMTIMPFLVVFVMAFSVSGSLLFGGEWENFSSSRLALQTIAQGLFGSWDFTITSELRPFTSIYYNMFFTAIMTIVVNNIILAMVANASMEAHKISNARLLSEQVCHRHELPLLYGDLFYFILAWRNYRPFLFEKVELKSSVFSRRFVPNIFHQRPHLPSVCRNVGGRLLFPSECLMFRLGPNRINELLSSFHHEGISTCVYGSLVHHLIRAHETFCEYYPIRELDDQATEAEMCELVMSMNAANAEEAAATSSSKPTKIQDDI